MASPPRSSLAPSDASNDPRSHVFLMDDREHHSKSSTQSNDFNIPPAVPTLSFSVTYDTLNHGVELLDPHRASNQYPPQLNFNPTSHPGSGPRRGSFSDILPHGHTPPPPINAGMPTVQAGRPDLPTGVNAGVDDVQTDSDPEFRYSVPSLSMNQTQTPSSVTNADDADKDTVVIVGGVATSGIAREGSTPTAGVSQSAVPGRNKQYVLPNGAVVSGKGLGRGRPGIKRGPRSTKAAGGDQNLPQVVPANATDQPSYHFVPPSKKRKSGASDTSESNNQRASTSASTATPSRESSEEYTPSGQTRSGRQIQKLITLRDGTPVQASPSRKLSRNNSTANTMSNSPASIKTHPKIKRRVYRGREQFALCEHCMRGHGPPGNVIVFCDACNKCWHQRCHEPQISPHTVADSKAEWFCSECDRILHGKKKDKKANGKTSVQATIVAPPIVQQKPTFTGPRVGGRFLRPEQKEAYLKTLSRDDLLLLVLHASDLAPDLPLFQTLAPPPPPPPPPPPQLAMPQAQFTSTYVTPVSKVPSFGANEVGEDNEVDEGYDGYFDEHAALYPKPGNGVQLPPESEDLHILLEGKDCRTFSHWVQGMPGNLFSGSGNVSSTIY
ncbi:uncharacterized protein Z520_00075 [Fonsecaea multimorphosa CBS 102226]|uniref:PHD-type domain-containing protein n=1 Tax=Fonsecaea multimorphosa CBS 102226 TaxID=1442371 RepID=A0A0D2L2X1_9EURO|nr:uncharacterized protein Z520_00075 [Fonsecaea multimorphosa CBS 102226]KIY03384.1 hypothetical protein Z520_00075 [Fonsecaea multimorphosa CBS 102226]OAL33034.1 hypothetical protein AYO22_00119 [Fonsecaea multimorphosa]